MAYNLDHAILETQLRAINEQSANIYDWVVNEFEATQAWVEITQVEFIDLADNPTLWTKEGEGQFGPYQNRFKWTATNWYIQSYRNDNAPIKGWMRRAMQKVHALRKYSQKDIERIGKAIRLSVIES